MAKQTTSTPTAEEIAAARAIVEQADAAAAAAAAESRRTLLAPLLDLIATPAWAQIRDGLAALRPSFVLADTEIATHLGPIPDFMDRVAAAAAVQRG